MKRIVVSVFVALLTCPALVQAGPAARSGSGWSAPPSATSTQPAPTVRGASAVRVSLVVPGMMATEPGEKPVYATLVGPDGQSRRFLVEGGRAAIRYTNVVVRPGQSVTIRWVAAK